MNIFNVLILSVVQGITEFLPISSSGHLVILQKLLGLNQPMVTFDIVLHVGSLIAVLFYFRNKIINILKGIIKKDKMVIKLCLLIIVATIPAVIFSLLFDKQIEATFSSIKINGFLFIVTALLLFSTKSIKNSDERGKTLDWKGAVIIGLFQALAILPAISRSGATITSSLWRKISRQDAFEFSFLLAIPAILGALIFKIKDITALSSADISYGFVGLVVSAIVGIFSLRFLNKVLISDKFYLFGFYCLILGLLILVL